MIKSFKQYLVEISQSTINRTVNRFKQDYPEQVTEISRYVNEYNRLQAKGLVKGTDITQLSLTELKALVDWAGKEKTKSEIRKEIKVSGADKVFENDKVVVIRPKTLEASQYYGAGTKWCITEPRHPDITTSDRGSLSSWWDEYKSKGNTFYFIIPKYKNDSFLIGTTDKVAVMVTEDGYIKAWDDEDDELLPEQLDDYLEYVEINKDIFQGRNT